MRGVLVVAAWLIVSLGLTGSANAWKFAMPAEFEWSYRFLSPNSLNSLVALPDKDGKNWSGSPSDQGRPGIFRSDGSRSLSACNARLTLSPSFEAGRFVRFGSEFTVRKRNADVSGRMDRITSGESYRGLPPFELYYRGRPESKAPEWKVGGSCEQFWLGVGHRNYGGIWAGARKMPFGTGATLGSSFRNEMAVAEVPYGPLTFTLGTGAALPRNLPDDALKTRPPFSSLLFQGYTGAYTAVTAVYAAGAAAVTAVAGLVAYLIFVKPWTDPYDPNWPQWKKDLYWEKKRDEWAEERRKECACKQTKSEKKVADSKKKGESESEQDRGTFALP